LHLGSPRSCKTSSAPTVSCSRNHAFCCNPS